MRNRHRVNHSTVVKPVVREERLNSVTRLSLEPNTGTEVSHIISCIHLWTCGFLVLIFLFEMSPFVSVRSITCTCVILDFPSPFFSHVACLLNTALLHIEINKLEIKWSLLIVRMSGEKTNFLCFRSNIFHIKLTKLYVKDVWTLKLDIVTYIWWNWHRRWRGIY